MINFDIIKLIKCKILLSIYKVENFLIFVQNINIEKSTIFLCRTDIILFTTSDFY